MLRLVSNASPGRATATRLPMPCGPGLACDVEAPTPQAGICLAATAVGAVQPASLSLAGDRVRSPGASQRHDQNPASRRACWFPSRPSWPTMTPLGANPEPTAIRIPGLAHIADVLPAD